MEKPIYGVAMRQNGVVYTPTLYYFLQEEAWKDLNGIRDIVQKYNGKITSERDGYYGKEFTVEYQKPKKEIVDYYIVRAWIK